MAHLGADVAAYVDGQLSVHATRAADAHLQECEACAHQVRQQQLIKARMGAVAAPAPPADLIDTLTRLQTVPPTAPSWWVRLCRAAPATIGIAVVGASLTVLAVAYAVGAEERFDRVRPGFEAYAAEFLGGTATTRAATYAAVGPDRLTAEGWPCHEMLAGDLSRTSTAFDRIDDVVAVSYTNGSRRLQLYEQVGRLDPAVLHGFERVRLGGTHVWLRLGHPTLVTWDRDGVVFTIVSDADIVRIAEAVAQLPAGDPGPSLVDRIGGGLRQMTTWAAA